MSNSTITYDPILQAQASKEAKANEYFDAASPATFFGRRASTSSGLTWGYYGGTMLVDGALTQLANGTLLLTAASSATNNYIEITRAGVISKNNTGFTPGSIPLYLAVASNVTNTVTSYTDYRAWVQPVDQTSKQSTAAITTGDVTITADQARARFLTANGALTGNRNLIVPDHWMGEVINTCTGAYTLTVKTSGGAGIVVAQGATALLYSNGTNVLRRTTDSRNGKLVKAMANVNQTLSQDESLNQILEATGAISGTLKDLIVPIIDARQWTIFANVTGGFGVRVIGATGTGVTIADGKRAIVYADGTNVVRVTPDT